MTFTTIKDASDHISMCRAVMTLIVNLLLPGIGTIMSVKNITATQIRDSQAKLSSHSIYRVKIPYNEHCEIIKKRALKLGLLQVITCPILLIGWVWALFTSV